MGMGEQKKRAKAFKQKTAKTVESNISAPTLFSGKQVESELTFECLLYSANDLVIVGEKVKLIDMQDRIEVYDKLLPVGYVVTSQIDETRQMLKLQERKSQSVAAEIIDVSDLTPTFVVRVG